MQPDTFVLSPNQLEEVKLYVVRELPRILRQDPQFVTFIEGIIAEQFPRRDEFALLLEKITSNHQEIGQQIRQLDDRTGRVEQKIDHLEQRFDHLEQRVEGLGQKVNQLDQKIDGVESRLDQKIDDVEQRLTTRMDKGFHELHLHIDRLGARWGIRNESIFRQTMRELLEKSFGLNVEQRQLRGEEYDCVISNGTHVLIEIAASAGPNILKRLQRKRQIYIEETGIVPERFLLAVGSIHSKRAEALRGAGFEVIEPEEPESDS